MRGLNAWQQIRVSVGPRDSRLRTPCAPKVAPCSGRFHRQVLSGDLEPGIQILLDVYTVRILGEQTCVLGYILISLRPFLKAHGYITNSLHC